MAFYAVRVKPDGTIDEVCSGCKDTRPTGGRYDETEGLFYCSWCWKAAEAAEANADTTAVAAPETVTSEPSKVATSKEGDSEAPVASTEAPETRIASSRKPCYGCRGIGILCTRDASDGKFYCADCIQAWETPEAEQERKEPAWASTDGQSKDNRRQSNSNAGGGDRDDKYDLLLFLRSQEELLENDPSAANNQAVIGAVLERIEGKVVTIADDQRASKTLEKLIESAQRSQYISMIDSLLGKFSDSARSPYASHVLQTCLRGVWPCLEALWDSTASVDHEAYTKFVARLESTTKSLYRNVKNRAPVEAPEGSGSASAQSDNEIVALMTDACATHPLRSLLLCLAGFTPEKPKMLSASALKKKKQKAAAWGSQQQEDTAAGATAAPGKSATAKTDLLPETWTSPPLDLESCIGEIVLQVVAYMQKYNRSQYLQQQKRDQPTSTGPPLHCLPVDTYAGPVLMLLLRICKYRCDEASIDALVMAAFGGGGSHLPQLELCADRLVRSQVGSRVMEVVLETASSDVLDRVLGRYFAPRLRTWSGAAPDRSSALSESTPQLGLLVAQKLVDVLQTPAQVETVLGSMDVAAAISGRAGVPGTLLVYKVCEACVRLAAGFEGAAEGILNGLGVSMPSPCVWPILLALRPDATVQHRGAAGKGKGASAGGAVKGQGAKKAAAAAAAAAAMASVQLYIECCSAGALLLSTLLRFPEHTIQLVTGGLAAAVEHYGADVLSCMAMDRLASRPLEAALKASSSVPTPVQLAVVRCFLRSEAALSTACQVASSGWVLSAMWEATRHDEPLRRQMAAQMVECKPSILEHNAALWHKCEGLQAYEDGSGDWTEAGHSNAGAQQGAAGGEKAGASDKLNPKGSKPKLTREEKRALWEGSRADNVESSGATLELDVGGELAAGKDVSGELVAGKGADKPGVSGDSTDEAALDRQEARRLGKHKKVKKEKKEESEEKEKKKRNRTECDNVGECAVKEGKEKKKKKRN